MKIWEYKEASEIWLTYKAALRNYLLKRVRDENLAEELTQVVLMKVYKSCCSDRNINNVRSWLFQITHNVLIDHYKKVNQITHDMPDLEMDSEASVWQEISTYLTYFLKLLPEKYATPLRMSDLEGINQQTIAEKMDLSLSATKSRIQRARVMLKQEILNCSYIEFDRKGNPIDFKIREDCTPLQNILKK